jgi:methyl-accepting chemotaxis protein
MSVKVKMNGLLSISFFLPTVLLLLYFIKHSFHWLIGSAILSSFISILVATVLFNRKFSVESKQVSQEEQALSNEKDEVMFFFPKP